jgi:hypothetical protein
METVQHHDVGRRFRPVQPSKRSSLGGPVGAALSICPPGIGRDSRWLDLNGEAITAEVGPPGLAEVTSRHIGSGALWDPGGQGTELARRCDKKGVTVLERSWV